MPRSCTICQHPHVTAINKALVDDRESLRTIADQWSVSKTALIRHKEDHVPAHLAKAKEAQEVAQADTLLDQVQAARARLDRLLLASEGILGRAYQSDNHRLALEAIRTATGVHREVRGYLDLLGELEGELSRQPQVNVTIDAHWVQVLLQALAPYPDAKQAAAQAILEVDDATS